MFKRGIKEKQTLRSSSALTNTYVASSVIDISGYDQVIFYVSYTEDAAEANNDLYYYVEFSPDNSTWYKYAYEKLETPAAGKSTIYPVTDNIVDSAGPATATNFRVPFEGADTYMRIWVKEVGVAANYGTCAIDIELARLY